MEDQEINKNPEMNNPEHIVYFNTRDELTKVCLDDVMYVLSEGNYITLRFRSGRTLGLLASMMNFEQIVASISDLHFVRIGRSHIINTSFLAQVNCLRKSIVLVDDFTGQHIDIVVPREASKTLKQLLTEMPHKDIEDFSTNNGNMEAFRIIDS